FNLKGTVLELAHRNAQVSVPFYLSDRGYGFLWNNPAVGTASFGTNRTEWRAEATPQMDYWVTAGDAPAEILHRYALATGLPSAMPDFATGFGVRALSDGAELLGRAEYKRRGLPISSSSSISAGQSGVWDFDGKYWPDPRPWCGSSRKWASGCSSPYGRVDPRSPYYAEMLERATSCTRTAARGRCSRRRYETFFDDEPEERALWDKIKELLRLRHQNYWLTLPTGEHPYQYDNR
ncbi:MAG: family 31 glucosidase, partial [Butyricicoccus sp.]